MPATGLSQRQSRWLSVALMLLVGAAIGAPATPEARPWLFLSQADFTRLKQSSAPHVRRAIDVILKQAKRLVGQEIETPKAGGGWIFELNCPVHGVRLKRLEPLKYQCSRDKRLWEGEKFENAYVTSLHNRAAGAVKALALAYRFSGERAYAEKAAGILLRYADQYAGYVRHDRWGRTGMLAFMGGKRYPQALTEAVNLIPCCWAYDLIADAGVLDAAQLEHIEKDFFRAAARELQVPTFQHNNNHQTWINAGIASVGFVLRDQALIDVSIDGKHGFHYQMGRCVADDGLWIEGTMAYQGYAMQPLVMHARMASMAGIDLSVNKPLRSLFDGPMTSAFPNGSFPIINDSDPYHLRSLAHLYEWAFAVWGDQRYAAVAALGGRRGQWAWLLGAPKLDAPKLVPLGSRDLTGIGYLFLERPLGGAPASLVIDYGQHGGGHGHPDKLNIILFAGGGVRLVDPGRITYSVPEYKSWCKQTVAHNTIVVDGKSQKRATGECLWFAAGKDFAAAAVRSDKAYRGVDLRRIVAMTDEYVLDCYLVESKKERQYDWLAHPRGKLDVGDEFAPLEGGLGKDEGYQHLTNVRRRAPGRQGGELTFLDRNGSLRLIAAASDTDEEWLVGTGIGIRLRDHVPFLIRRRRAKRTLFATLYQFKAGKTGPEWGALRLEVANAGREALRLRVSSGRWLTEWELPLAAVAGAAGEQPVAPEAVPGLRYARTALPAE